MMWHGRNCFPMSFPWRTLSISPHVHGSKPQAHQKASESSKIHKMGSNAKDIYITAAISLHCASEFFFGVFFAIGKAHIFDKGLLELAPVADYFVRSFGVAAIALGAAGVAAIFEPRWEYILPLALFQVGVTALMIAAQSNDEIAALKKQIIPAHGILSVLLITATALAAT